MTSKFKACKACHERDPNPVTSPGIDFKLRLKEAVSRTLRHLRELGPDEVSGGAHVLHRHDARVLLQVRGDLHVEAPPLQGVLEPIHEVIHLTPLKTDAC